MREIVDMLKVLADENRLRIIRLLIGKKMCVCEIAFVLKITPAAVSRHLKKMKASGMINSEQAGYWTDYFLLKNGRMNSILKKVNQWTKHEKVIISDRKNAGKINRAKLCCR